MVRFIVLYNQPNDVPAFEAHYRDVHVPLTKKLPGLRRYTVSRPISAIRGEPYYLVAELDWDDMATLQAAFQSPEGQATARDVTYHLGRMSPDVRSMVYELEELQ